MIMYLFFYFLIRRQPLEQVSRVLRPSLFLEAFVAERVDSLRVYRAAK